MSPFHVLSHVQINLAPGLYIVSCCHAAFKHRKVTSTTGGSSKEHVTSGQDLLFLAFLADL